MRAKIYDNSFLHAGAFSNNMHLGENKEYHPKFFVWEQTDEYRDTCWFSDACIPMVEKVEAKRKIAWLLEPPSMTCTGYDYAIANSEKFDWILTHQRDLLKNGNKWLYYPSVGCLIHPSDWGIHPKDKDCSLIISDKNVTPGHKLRKEISGICSEFGVDVLGSGAGKHISKVDGLKSYRFSIVIEGENSPDFFTEKIVDCASVCTVPIYWGCGGNIGEYFDIGGIIPVSDLDDVGNVLGNLKRAGWMYEYISRLGGVTKNFRRAGKFFCTEDWIYEHYPFLFEEVEDNG